MNNSQYIRMNPWRCVTDFGSGLCGMLDRLLRELDVKDKIMKKEPHADER